MTALIEYALAVAMAAIVMNGRRRVRAGTILPSWYCDEPCLLALKNHGVDTRTTDTRSSLS